MMSNSLLGKDPNGNKRELQNKYSPNSDAMKHNESSEPLSHKSTVTAVTFGQPEYNIIWKWNQTHAWAIMFAAMPSVNTTTKIKAYSVSCCVQCMEVTDIECISKVQGKTQSRRNVSEGPASALEKHRQAGTPDGSVHSINCPGGNLNNNATLKDNNANSHSNENPDKKKEKKRKKLNSTTQMCCCSPSSAGCSPGQSSPPTSLSPHIRAALTCMWSFGLLRTSFLIQLPPAQSCDSLHPSRCCRSQQRDGPEWAPMWKSAWVQKVYKYSYMCVYCCLLLLQQRHKMRRQSL